MANATKKKRKKGNPLYDPGTVLTGPALRRAAEAAARIEYRPQIAAHKNELEQIARMRQRDDAGLARLGRKVDRDINATFRHTNQQMQGAITDSIRTGNQLQADNQDSQDASRERMDALQTGILGGQLESMGSVQPGGSAAEAALADSARLQQRLDAKQGRAFDAVANSSAAAMEDLARNRLLANQKGQVEARKDAGSAIMSRRADSRAGYGDAEMEVRNSLRTVRGLRGATKLNNIMKLRDSERSFVNERAALMQDAQDAANDYKVDMAKINDPTPGSGGGGGGDGPLEPEDVPRKIAPFWADWLAAANQVRNGQNITPGSWNKFLDQVEEDKNLDWSPTQRQKFLKKYKQWYGKHVGK